MPTKATKSVLQFFEANGFEYARTNARNIDYYNHPICGEVGIQPGIQEHAAKHLIISLQKRIGIVTDAEKAKRNPEAIKERQALDRVRLAEDIERHEKDIAVLVLQRESSLGGLGKVLTSKELRAIERLITQKQRELREWQSIMTAIPGARADAGRPKARHHS